MFRIINMINIYQIFIKFTNQMYKYHPIILKKDLINLKVKFVHENSENM